MRRRKEVAKPAGRRGTPSASSTGRATRGVVAELVGLCRERRCYCRALVSPPWVSRHVSCGVPVGNGVDEGLIVLRIRAVGDRDRLPVGLGGKALRANVGNPDLDGTKTRGAQCLAVLLHTLGDRAAQTLPGPGWTHAILLKKVTCNNMHSCSVTCNAYRVTLIRMIGGCVWPLSRPRSPVPRQNHRHADGIGAIELEAAPRYQIRHHFPRPAAERPCSGRRGQPSKASRRAAPVPPRHRVQAARPQRRSGKVSVELWLALTGRSPAICVHSAPPTVLKCSVSTRAHPIND